MGLVVGIDLGTQSLKAVVCDDLLAVLGAHHVGYPTSRPGADRVEQDPARWEAALAPAIAGALAAAGGSAADVVALAIVGQLDGCVAVDAAGAALHPALIWQDRRATAALAALDRLTPLRLFELTGQVADPSHLAAKIRWLRDHGVRATRYHVPTSYLVERLTGVAVLDPAHASTTMLAELAGGATAWSAELCAAFAIDPSELPSIRATTSIAGALHAAGAACTGLPVGTVVAVGTGDDFSTPLGAGLSGPGRVFAALGTAEVVGALSSAVVLDVPHARGASRLVSNPGSAGLPADPAQGSSQPARSEMPSRLLLQQAAGDAWRAIAAPMVETHVYPAGGFLVENPGWLSGGAIRWAVELLGLRSDRELDEAAATAPPGADGITFVPALAGAMTPRWRPTARGTLHGLAASHDRGHVARAVLEGLAFACRDVVERLAALGLSTEDVVVLGGGGASATWVQLRADALGRAHHVAARPDSSAVGAAMIAAVAARLADDLATVAARGSATAASYAATQAHAAAYADAYDRYCAVVRALDPDGLPDGLPD